MSTKPFLRRGYSPWVTVPVILFIAPLNVLYEAWLGGCEGARASRNLVREQLAEAAHQRLKEVDRD